MTTNKDALDAVKLFEKITELARNTLWISYVWNDHNFDHAHIEAQKTCKKSGINSWEDANAFIDEMNRLGNALQTQADLEDKLDKCEHGFGGREYLLGSVKCRLEEIEALKKTQAELEAKNKELSRQIEILIKENAKYEERHKAWSEQVYLASPTPMIMATKTTEYGDDSGTIPVAKMTDLLDKKTELVEAGKELRESIEGLKGSMEHGTWRNDNGARLKDTPEWVKFYLSLARAEGKE